MGSGWCKRDGRQKGAKGDPGRPSLRQVPVKAALILHAGPRGQQADTLFPALYTASFAAAAWP
jgi:hypothetical protein